MNEQMDDSALAFMASVAGAMAAGAHHSTRVIESHLSARLVELYDSVQHVHARLGHAMETGNMFKMMSAYEDLGEILALAEIGMDYTRETAEYGS